MGGKAPDGHRAGHDARRAGSGGTGVVDRVVFPARSGARPPAAGERGGDRGSRAFGAELEDDGVGAVVGEERANVSRRVRGEHVRDADEVNDGPAGAILEADNPRRPGRGRPPGLGIVRSQLRRRCFLGHHGANAPRVSRPGRAPGTSRGRHRTAGIDRRNDSGAARGRHISQAAIRVSDPPESPRDDAFFWRGQEAWQLGAWHGTGSSGRSLGRWKVRLIFRPPSFNLWLMCDCPSHVLVVSLSSRTFPKP